MNWHDGPMLGFDTETTSIDSNEARIVSAAFVLDVPAEEKRWVKTWLVNPGIEIPLEATAIHGISTEEVQLKGMNTDDALYEMFSAVESVKFHYGDVPLAIFNGAYDLTVLDREILRTGMQITPLCPVTIPMGHVIDPLVIDRKVDKYRRGRRTLAAMTAAYGIPIKGAHTAAGDVLCTIKLARAIGRTHPVVGNLTLAALQDFQVKAHAEWAVHYEEYLHSRGNPDARINGDWPLVRREVL